MLMAAIDTVTLMRIVCVWLYSMVSSRGPYPRIIIIKPT